MARTAASPSLLRIGQLAREAGFTAKTLRYYEEVGLLLPAARASNGYRLYDDGALRRLTFVRKAKAVGLSLADIQNILRISNEGRAPCEHVVAVIERELAAIERQMQRLQELRRDLVALKSRLNEAIASGTAAPGGGCPCFEEVPENEN